MTRPQLLEMVLQGGLPSSPVKEEEEAEEEVADSWQLGTTYSQASTDTARPQLLKMRPPGSIPSRAEQEEEGGGEAEDEEQVLVEGGHEEEQSQKW